MKPKRTRAATARSVVRPFWEAVYETTLLTLLPMNRRMAERYRDQVRKGSVLHVSAMVHVPWYTVRTLRKHGVDADYMAVGSSPVWDRCDHHVVYSRWPMIRAFQEFRVVWDTVSSYEIVHSHFMHTATYSGWEWPLLKEMGRKLVIHYRGCEIRDREENIRRHPDVNICQECDYTERACRDAVVRRKRVLAAKHGDLFLATTPDLLDFAPGAVHLPFLVPEIDEDARHPAVVSERGKRGFRIVHATNHEGIEGTRQIRETVERLIARGYGIDFVTLTGVSHDRILAELAAADLSVGKMKMGYYANFQIESLLMGVPAVTWVRDGFVTREIRESGLILTDLSGLEETLRHLLDHPEVLALKKAIARDSVFRLHPNDRLARRMADGYDSLTGGAKPH